MHKPKGPPTAPLLTVSVNEALRVTGIGRTLLYDLIDSGQLRRVKVGRRTLIRFDDLQRLVSADPEERSAA